MASAAGVNGSDRMIYHGWARNVGISERIICVPTPSLQDEDPGISTTLVLSFPKSYPIDSRDEGD